MRPALLRMAIRYLENSDEAEDAVQDALLKLWFLRDRLDQYRSVDALAIVITKHLCINRLRGTRIEKVDLEQGIINGVKLADGRASYIQGMKHYCPDGITALYGHDYEPLPAFFAGADGWLSGLPGIFPKFCVDLFNLCTVQQDAPAARKLWDKMQDFIDYFITYSNNDPHWHEVFKYVLKCFGFNAGLPRMPLGDLLPEEKKKVDALLADMDVTIKATNLIK